MTTITQICGTLGIDTSAAAIGRLEHYADEVVRWNRRVNLTGAKSAGDFIGGPLFDALTLIPILAPVGTLVDVGSGGGLPGIPAALLVPGIQLTLVEPRAKRASFLRHVVHLLGLDVTVLEARDETLKRHHWRGAVAQAVFAPSEWVLRATHLIEPGGCIYVLSTDDFNEEDLPKECRIDAVFNCRHPLRTASRKSLRVVMDSGADI